MRLTIHPEAEREVGEAANYYDRQRWGLGAEFMEAVTEAGARAVDSPMAWAEIEPGIRRIVVERFPYNILYVVSGNGMFVVAVMHQKRRPGYWKQRLEES